MSGGGNGPLTDRALSVGEGTDLLFETLTFRLRGALFQVYNGVGVGYGEGAYQEALEIELSLLGIPFKAQQELPLSYKGHVLRRRYKPDFICFESIILELKVATELCAAHRAQVHSYLRASGLRLGLLANFGHHPGIEVERIVL